MADPAILGLDIGSVAVSAALLDRRGGLLCSAWRMHAGRIPDALRSALSDLAGAAGPVPLLGIGLTAASPSAVRGPLLFGEHPARSNPFCGRGHPRKNDG